MKKAFYPDSYHEDFNIKNREILPRTFECLACGWKCSSRSRMKSHCDHIHYDRNNYKENFSYS